MLNGDGNENCKKIDTLISNKKQLCKCAQHTFLYISLPFFCTTTTLNLLVTQFMGKKMSYVLTEDFVQLAFLFAFLSLPLIFTLLASPR